MPLATLMPQEPPLQLAATTVAITLTHITQSQISRGEGDGRSSSDREGGRGKGDKGPPE